ncbi:hypothetical protein ADK70_04510 [Streptomyces rimosus subsp. pseudoverticillatus]|uniref:DUF4760 domain-containing protein n=1 Tax=Streptomyces rimosus TaxID=1927 RepID=UPI0006B285BF|nr:hypothetical protein [Streptomyces rimosus]KOT99271.1 hypothetical protein ADK70_04510 [Streptomyces rimosus subsp. pseudoverticillatus]
MLKLLLVNVLPITIALLAVTITTRISVTQRRISQHSNNIQAMINLLDEFRSVAFHDQHTYVCDRIPKEHDPSGGVRGLSDEARAAFCNVVYYYQSFGTLTFFKVVDESVFLPLLRHRIIEVWKAVQPFVEQERALRCHPTYLQSFEEIARRATELPSTYLQRRILNTRPAGRRRLRLR